MSGVNTIVYHAILNKRIDVGAVYDSEEQSDTSRCYPGTNQGLIDITINWIGDGEKRLAWANGFAGTGKTALLLSVAERCHQGGLLAASFFSSTSNKRDIRTLFPTIIYQLSSNHIIASSIGEDLTQFFSKNPEIFEKSLESQADSLLRLFKKPSQYRTNWPKAIILDGFDHLRVNGGNYPESPEQKSSKQKQALVALLKLTVDDDFPFRIVVGSRQEPTIEEFMNDDATHPHAVRLDLNIFLGVLDSLEIGAYLETKFEEMRRKPGFPKNRHRFTLSPFNEPQRNILVARSAGYFAYASAIARFIENGAQLPHVQLAAVLEHKEEAWDPVAIVQGTECENPPPNPFADLDVMYSDILNSCVDPQKAATILRVIHIHVEGKDSSQSVPAYFWNHIFESSCVDQGLLNGGFRRLLQPLCGLMKIPAAHNTTAPFEFCHSESLFKFLGDKRRCGKFWMFEVECEIYFAKFYWAVVERKYFSSAPPGEQEALFRHLFSLTPYFLCRSLHEAVARCDADWWVERNIALERKDNISFAFDGVHVYCSWYWCPTLCSKWREAILRKCKEAGWTVPDLSSLRAIYEDRISYKYRDTSAAFCPPKPNVGTE